MYRVRGRLLFVYLGISLLVPILIVGKIWPGEDDPAFPWPTVTQGVAFYTILLALLARPLRRAGGLSALRRPPSRHAVRWAVVTGVAMVFVAFVGFFAVYLPLSYVAPQVVERLLLDQTTRMFWTHGTSDYVASGVQFLVLVFLAPLVEETFFRRLLLPSWAARFGLTRGVIFSSLAFAAFHAEIVGCFIFGVMASRAFLRTGNLWVPIMLHATNNALVWGASVVEFAVVGEKTETLADLQSQWWLGLVGVGVGAPLLFLMWRKMPAWLPPSPPPTPPATAT